MLISIGNQQYFWCGVTDSGLPHRVMYLDVQNVRQRWEDAGHAWSEFMFYTEHPDLHQQAIA